MGFTKIENSDLTGIGVIGLPDQPGLSTGAMQSKFEETSRSVIIPKHNALIDELEDTTSAASLGATPLTNRASSPNVQAVMEKLSTDLKTVEDGMAEAIADAHTHDNKELLDTYSQTEANLADAVSKKHEHSNKSLLDTYSQTEANLADAVSKKHEHSNKSLLDSYTQTEANLANAVSNTHSHSNKALLDTYSQSESDLADAVSKKHEHSNKSVIDDLSDDGSGHLLYDGNPIGGGSVNNAYKSVKVTSGADDTTISASGEDTFELRAGNNVTLSVDTTSTPKKITVNSTGGGGGGSYTPGDGIDISGDTIALDYGMLTGSNLTKPVVGKDIADALGGKADTSDIPANLSDLADDTTHRTVTDTEKATWNAKAPLTLLDDTVGWVGKNKLNAHIDAIKAVNTAGTWSGNVYTWNGVVYTLTLNDGGYVTKVNVNGTAGSTGSTPQLFLPFNGLTGNYILNGCADGGGDGVFDAYIWNFTTDRRVSQSAYNSNANISFEISSSISTNDNRYVIRVMKGVTISNKDFYPMLRDASITDSTFEPYHKSVEDWGYTREEAKANGAYNLLDHNMKTHTGLGVTFTVNSDKSISLSGTSSGDIQNSEEGGFLKDISYLPYGKYKLTGCPSGGSSSTYRLTIANAASDTFISDTGEGLEFEVNANTTWKYLYIRANSGVNLTGKVYKPMITRDMVATYDDYVPYAMTNRELTEKVVPTTDVKNTVISTYCDTTNSIINIVRVGNIVQVTAVVAVTTAIPAYTKFMEGLPNALFPSNGGNARVVNFFLFTGSTTHYRCYMDGTGNVNNHATQIPTGNYALSFMYVAQ